MSPADPSRHGILVVDDHPIVRLGVRQMIEAEPDLEICAEAGTSAEALAQAIETRPELAIVDLSLMRDTGLELIRQLRDAVPGVNVLVLSMHDESLYAERVLRAGARGYIMKRAAITGLIQAIREVLQGRVYLSDAMAQTMLERLRNETARVESPLSKLTDREIEVLDLIRQQMSTAQIADRLGVSIKTIETYRSNLRTKLNLKNAADLIHYAASLNDHC